MAKSIYYFKMGEVPNFQLFSSQNPDLDNEQLDEIEQKAQAKNTKTATEWRVKKFEKWCEKRKITVDLKTVSLSATDLSEILRKFFAEVKTEKGQALTQSALPGIRAAIHRHLMHGSILRVTIPPPPGNPRDKSSPSGPGVGNCLKRFCPGGRGAGKIENNFSFFL